MGNFSKNLTFLSLLNAEAVWEPTVSDGGINCELLRVFQLHDSQKLGQKGWEVTEGIGQAVPSEW